MLRLNLLNLILVTEMGSALVMVILATSALIFICRSKTRGKSAKNTVIFISLILSFSCEAFLSFYAVLGDDTDINNINLLNASVYVI